MDNIINSFVASMNGKSETQYVDEQERLLDQIGAIQNIADDASVETLEDYLKYMDLYHLISGITCYVWNSGKDDTKVVTAEKTIWNKLYKFCKNYNRLSGDLLAFGKYICWSKHYRRISDEQMLKLLDLIKGHIFKKNGHYYLTGMHLAVGDNTFTRSQNGSYYRNYVKTLGLQALPINGYTSEYIKKYMDESVLALPEFYETTSIGNWKHAVKISVSENDLAKVRKIIGIN